MNDANGRKIRVGDEIEMWSSQFGRVIGDFEAKEFSDEVDQSEWDYIENGILIMKNDGSIFKYDSPDEDLKVVEHR